MTNNINYEEVSNFLLNLVSDKTGESAGDINVDAPLADLNLDSLDVLDLTFEAELKYDIAFPKESAGLTTLKDVIDLTHQLTSE